MPDEAPLVTISIPVYNEAGNIEKELRELHDKLTCKHRIAIVYDFDEDNTLPVARKVQTELNLDLELVRNKYGRGVLNAIKTGLETPTTKYVVVTMADLSDPPEVINEMIAKAESTGADIVCASRYMKGGSQTGGPLLKGLMSRCAGLSLHYLAGIPTHDATNSFKLYRKESIDKLTIESSGGFELGIELVVKTHKRGGKIAEAPTQWTDRVAGKSNFKLMKWLPKYLKWYFMAFLPSGK